MAELDTDVVPKDTPNILALTCSSRKPTASCIRGTILLTAMTVKVGKGDGMLSSYVKCCKPRFTPEN